MASTVNEPITAWAPSDGNSEVVQVGVLDIADELGNLLADTTGLIVADTGIDYSLLAATQWSQNDSE